MGFLSLVPAWAWRWIAIGLLAVAVFAFGYFRGNEHGTQKLIDYQAKQAAEAVRIVTKQGEVTTKVVTEYVKVKGATQVVTQTVEKEVLKYATANPTFTLDREWRSLHDRSALNTVSSSPGGSDAQGGAPPTAAEALSTVTTNYAACNRTADRLDGLQDWVRGQANVR